MNQVQASRLLTLAWFLKTQVPEEQFDMGLITNRRRPLVVGECGSSGCAIGWCTCVFPRVFEAYNKGLVCVSGDLSMFCGVSIREFFGLSLREAKDAFGPTPRTPTLESVVLENIALRHGWEYA